MKIWLCDLTYTQQSISSDVVPAAIGMIAEYAEKNIPDLPQIQLFKYPEDLSKQLRIDQPEIIGFSNFIWNSFISDAFMKKIKELFPKIITISGGPNFPTNIQEKINYLKQKSWIDYYVEKEGEHPFYLLIKAIKDKQTEIIKEIPNVVFYKNNNFYSSNNNERILDLSQIPSPYLSGRLDKFLDGKLLPIIQTNRGCPFSCTFCTEGQLYWNKVKTKPRNVVTKEIEYIADKMNKLSDGNKRTDLIIADSNFGMFEEDLETCRIIAKSQKDTNYPKYINVATGKNKKERVLEAAKIVNGSMKIAGSVQSLDPVVQKNIKRSNISPDQIVDVALKANEVGANTYSEVILGLPGDTMIKHFTTLKSLVESSFTTISMYQLMILPGTELGSENTKKEYEMKTQFRVVPRCFGYYDILGEVISVAEIEEICTSTNTLSFDDYLECRTMNIIVNIFYNDGIFEELIFLIKKLKLPIWDWLESIYFLYSEKKFLNFNNFLEDFRKDTKNELWENFDDLNSFIKNKDNIIQFIDGKLGANLIFKYKSRAITTNLEEMSQVAFESFKKVINEKLIDDSINKSNLLSFARDILMFKVCQVKEIFDLKKEFEFCFDYDVENFLTICKKNEHFDLELLKLKSSKIIKFSLSKDQIDQIKSYNKIFSNSIDGISRTLSRVYIKKLFRKTELSNLIVPEEFNYNNSRRSGGGLESI